MGEGDFECRILVKKPFGKRLIGRPRIKCEVDMQYDFEIGCESQMLIK